MRATHSHTFTHLGVVEYHQCHCILLTDHLHQSLRSVRLHGLCLREMRKGKIGPVQGEIKLSSCSVRLCTHTLSSLTPPRCPTLPSLVLPPLLSRFSSRYMCSEQQLGQQFRARSKGAHTHQQRARLHYSTDPLLYVPQGYGTHTHSS